ncbi:hypothetical protein [Bradyrhizobium sp.]|uniref:hypothetical protein n=1 Tax=Bradyrhizobium sp. TaxID=376 RepID=UPI004037984E
MWEFTTSLIGEFASFLSTHEKLVTAWTAIAALIVSFLALLATIANSVMQRRHNRKSVHPIGHISVGDYENQLFVRIRNDGIGPMIVKKVTVRNQENGETKGSIIDFMTDLPFDYQWTTFVGDITDRAISANDHLTLILLEGDVQDDRFLSSRHLVRQLVSKLSIQVKYENIYGERMAPASRNLDWFGRLL